MKKSFFIFCWILICSVAFCAAEDEASENLDENLQGRPITLRDFGSDDLGFLTLPNVPPQYGVLILHDSYGLTDAVKKRCDWIAERGDIGLALDLFNGHVAKNAEEAVTLQKELRPESALEAVRAALKLLEESPRLGAPQIIVVALGQQCPLSLQALQKYSPKIIGLSWIAPAGKFDEKLFKKSNLPMQVIFYRSNEATELLRENLTSKRKQLTILVKSPSPPSDLNVMWDRAFSFWQECALGKWRYKNFFDKIFEE
ncbi:MAG: dienelactone hydrolase family protein [Verrucomicrobiota bacterium]